MAEKEGINVLEKKKILDFFTPKCPKCGSRETKTTSHSIGGLIVPMVDIKSGKIRTYGKTKNVSKTYCKKCGHYNEKHPGNTKSIR